MKKDEFFQKIAALGLALTFDDVKLKTTYSKVMPDEVELESKFSKNVPLIIPVVSAAMDNVTGYLMAIEMARLGGLGVIHKGMAIGEQASAVARVKLHQHGIIRINDLITIEPNQDMDSVFAMKENFKFSTFPVIDKRGKLLGVIFDRHFEFCQDNSKLVKEIMETKINKAPSDIEPAKAYQMMNKYKIKFLPLVDNCGKLTGLYTLKDLKRNLSGQSKNNVDANGQLLAAAAVGTGEEEKERVEALINKKVDVIVIDTAHGDSEPVIKMLKFIKKNYDKVDVVAGNISEPDSAIRLAEAGADGIKVGQGPGSICTTRVVAGVGCPQVTAIYNCVKALADKDLTDIPVCADGGIKYSGDITIAIGAGAHSVMLGNLLAGTDEAPGDIITRQGVKKKRYRGMGSIGAMLDSPGAAERYYQQGKPVELMIAQGIEGEVLYRGRVADVMLQYLGGLRHGMGYVGAANIEELREKADFHRYTLQGQIESHPHDVIVYKEAPNHEVKS